ncbi:MAG: hypothetical protein ABI682_06030 [Acidobacteriota bacterium]
MTFKSTVALCALLSLVHCRKEMPPPAPAPPARLKPTPITLDIPIAAQRAALRDAYRLGLDRRFLLAFGEVNRLASHVPSPPAAPAKAGFAEGHWTVRLGDKDLGTLPELPDFPDYLALLVQQARSSPHPAPAAGKLESPASQPAFLMPRLADTLRAADQSNSAGGSLADATRAFARLAFQMADPNEVAPLVSARAAALLAASQAIDPGGFVEEEVLLAHALGYTRHAETLARTLPAGSPLRLFETPQELAHLDQIASKPGASEAARYFALRRASSEGDLPHWREARQRFFPDNPASAVISTGVRLPLPRQLEVEARKELVSQALFRALTREVGGSESNDPRTEFDSKLLSAAGNEHGFLWDGPALTAYYQAQYFSPASLENGIWPPSPVGSLGPKLVKLTEANSLSELEDGGDGIGLPLLFDRVKQILRPLNPADKRTIPEVRFLVRRLDCRPSHRIRFAFISHYHLMDTRLAEDLHRSVLATIGEGSSRERGESAIYLGDWAELERILRGPGIKPAEAAALLWTWQWSYAERERLAAEYERLTAKFQSEWPLTNQYVDFLRAEKKYARAAEIGERWLRHNADPSLPGHFHAYVRLAHTWVLAGQPAKGRKVLEGMNDSGSYQNAMRNRGIAESLAAEGKLVEAETLLVDALRVAPNEPETHTEMVRLLWLQDRYKEAAKALVSTTHLFAQRDLCEALSGSLTDIFRHKTVENLAGAVDALVKEPALSEYMRCLPQGFVRAALWDDAFRVAEQTSFQQPVDLDTLLTRYGWMKEWKGRQQAGEWLNGKLRPADLRSLSLKAVYTKNDDLLWDLVKVDNSKIGSEEVWNFRVIAFALRKAGGEARRKELLAYYTPEPAKPDPYHTMGRYLLGLATEGQMFALATTPGRLSEVSYHLGVRAENERRFRDASDWYRIAVESPQDDSHRSLAMYRLSEWMKPVQGISKAERTPAAPARAD